MLLAYLRALTSDWIALFSGIGGVALLVVSITVFHERTVPRSVVAVIAAGCLLVSVARVWSAEHLSRMKAESDLRVALDDRTPKLAGSFDTIVTNNDATAPTNAPVAQAFVLLTVRGMGAPSVAEHWTLTVSGPEAQITLNPTVMPDPFPLRDETGKVIMTFHGKDALYEKAMQPIPRGGLVRGWIRYLFPGMKASALNAAGTTWTITFSDVTGRDWTAKYVMTGREGGDPVYHPGAENPFAAPGAPTP